MKAVIKELGKQVRGATLEVLEATPPAWHTWAPPGTSNHVTWHAGHCLWLQDVLCVQPLTGRSELPPGWAEAFGQHCRPVAQVQAWPPAEEIRMLLHKQLRRLSQLVDACDLERLSANAPPPRGGWPLASGILHGWHDEARHQGEMYLLLKLRRAAERNL